MANDRENAPQQTEASNTENIKKAPKEQFNELSELSLEERMNVADQIGIPVAGITTTAMGAISSQDDADERAADEMDEEDTNENADR